MKIKEFLELNNGEHVKIGFRNGTGFVWCGKVGESTMSELEKEQTTYFDRISTTYNNLRAKYEKLCEGGFDTWYNAQVKLMYQRWKSSHPSHLKFTAPDRGYMLTKYDTIKERMYRSINSYYTALGVVNPFFDSEVIDVYRATAPWDLGTIIMICEGTCAGKYWDEMECVNGVDISDDDDEDYDE